MGHIEHNKFLNNERKRFYRIILSTGLLLGFLGLAIVPPIVNFETTARVATHFITGEKIDCALNVSPSNSTEPFDAIVVPGANGVDDYYPNKAQRTRLRAAAVSYVNGQSNFIILQDGRLPEGANPKMNAKYLQTYVKVISGFKSEIPESNIIIDNNSVNTASGMAELKIIDQKFGFKKHLVVTSSSHGNRATLYACDNGIATSWESAEKLAVKVDLNQAIENDKKKSPPLAITLKEKSELILDMYDPGGKLTIPLKLAFLYLRKSNPELGHYFPLLLATIILSLRKIKRPKIEKARR